MATTWWIRNASLWLFSFVLLVLTPWVAGTSHHGHHGHDVPHLPFHRRNGTALFTPNITLSEAQDIVNSFHAAMAVANAARREHPSGNNYTLYTPEEIEEAEKPAPYLEHDTTNSTSAQKLRRRLLRRQFSNNNNTVTTSQPSPEPGDNAGAHSYTIPPEVVEAARLLAEANPPDTSSDSHHRHDAKMQKPSGLFQFVGNASQAPTVVLEPETLGSDGPSLRKRIPASEFWMENIVQRGVSPLAPTGYKVWRNVKDYGAVGNGLVDDTAAIQAAITDGGRCGANCGGSTIYPATVYFPPGTYLISSSLIMYYNTEMLGNPIDLPRLVAAPSFSGGGIIESNVYTGQFTQWYLNTANFMRSVRNFVIDIRAGSQTAMICGIHWQVAQATSLENIYFYMTDSAVNPATTQQGIYMDNGSGGFLSDLYFVGGNVGAYMGNQQCTSSGLYFSKAETALQIHWDWGWTMQNVVIDECSTGVTIVGGAGGPGSTGQGVGSMMRTDMRVSNTPLAVKTSLFADNSTAFVLMNSRFENVPIIVRDDHAATTLLAGSTGVTTVDAWGFGRVTDEECNTAFVNAQNISVMARPEPLVSSTSSGTPQNFFFTRRRPAYSDLGSSQLMDVKALGAKGDGVSDDAAVLNHILRVAANISAVVYFPHGIYMVSNTLHVPVGSRIIGNVWPQIMGYGARFSNELLPRAVVRVGHVGSVGSVEIQNMLFTVKGATAGAVLVEWNVHEAAKGSAGLWDSHFRVGGAQGSDLDTTTCPKTPGVVRLECKAASLFIHITSKASAYLENVWLWTSDHLIDSLDRTQINVYTARGILIESQGPTWLWGTSSEHHVLYQYQLSNAKNVLLGLIQTESPYYQPSPPAPAPFSPGGFSNDPTFANCQATPGVCSSWAVRIVDSDSVYVLGTGLYSWFDHYDQDCIFSERRDCQACVLETEQSSNVWIYNLITVGTIEMISPVNGNATMAAPNRNGFASSILAWLGGSTRQTGSRNFEGYTLYTPDNFRRSKLSPWTGISYHGSLGNDTLTASVCDAGYTQSLAEWVAGVNAQCGSATRFEDGSPLVLNANYIWYGVNETCLMDTNGNYCNTVIGEMLEAGVANMTTLQLCSTCYLARLKMMQETRYSAYAAIPFFQNMLERAAVECPSVTATATQPPLISPTTTPLPPICLSDNHHTVAEGDTCDTIAVAYDTCDTVLMRHGINMELFVAANPSVAPATCTQDLVPGRAYCVAPLRIFNVPYSHQGCWEHPTNEVVVDSALAVESGDWWGCGAYCFVEKGYSVFGIRDGTDCFCGDYLNNGSVVAANPASSCDTSCVMAGFCCGEEAFSVFTLHADPIVYVPPVIPIEEEETPGEETNATNVYFGCYTEASGVRALAHSTVVNATHMTLSMCAEFCQVEQNQTYYAVEYASECYCGNGLSRGFVRVDDSQCSMGCSGNSSESCGAGDRLSLWGPGNVEAPVGFKYYNCYAQDGTEPVLDATSFVNATGMSVDLCARHCVGQLEHKYFALQGGDACICGDDNPLPAGVTVTSATDCDVPCVGNVNEICGGEDEVSLYGAEMEAPGLAGGTKTYEGCYTEATSSRALKEASKADSAMTVEMCHGFCFSLGWTMFGLEYASECFCGDELQLGSVVALEEDCNMACSGNAGQMCGGPNRLNVYSVS
ncbi:pectate lyase superfamily protein-domain-containing protein [Podospora aff. communis PSN243]|uniref:Pectate lyase superfamily protein-domain-containing protein n=1 Tax=Podospora aff. communis PSN243 TaxID=3040156 RepID=A0AAV9G3J0_9PEZI|nr:pectate lyase superfamily protein-domain-containing protein [Podospora aff. communis PSN243]